MTRRHIYSLKARLGLKKTWLIYKDEQCIGVVHGNWFSRKGRVRVLGRHVYDFRVDHILTPTSKKDGVYLIDPSQPEGERVVNHVRPMRGVISPYFDFQLLAGRCVWRLNWWRLRYELREESNKRLAIERGSWWRTAVACETGLPIEDVILLLITIRAYRNFGHSQPRG